ncbi:MAG: vWA domain-containing protein [Candidatus Thermoplasmatota archaeon]
MTNVADGDCIPAAAETCEIVCVIDRSGSMLSMSKAAIDGFNTFIESQRGIDGNAKITVALFNHEYAIIHDGIDVKSVPHLTTDTYIPNGYTALFDAMGKTIGTVMERIARYTIKPKVLFMTITDGQENSSREFKDKRKLIDLINQRRTDGWEFLFVGSDPEGFDDELLASLGGASHAMCVPQSAVGQMRAYQTLACATTSYRAGGDISNWKDQSKDDDGDEQCGHYRRYKRGYHKTGPSYVPPIFPTEIPRKKKIKKIKKIWPQKPINKFGDGRLPPEPRYFVNSK